MSDGDAAGGGAGAEDVDAARMNADAIGARFYCFLGYELPEYGKEFYCDGFVGVDVDVAVVNGYVSVRVAVDGLRYGRNGGIDFFPGLR